MKHEQGRAGAGEHKAPGLETVRSTFPGERIICVRHLFGFTTVGEGVSLIHLAQIWLNSSLGLQSSAGVAMGLPPAGEELCSVVSVLVSLGVSQGEQSPGSACYESLSRSMFIHSHTGAAALIKFTKPQITASCGVGRRV